MRQRQWLWRSVNTSRRRWRSQVGRLKGDEGAAAHLGLKPSTLRTRLERPGYWRPATLRLSLSPAAHGNTVIMPSTVPSLVRRKRMTEPLAGM
jgi:hypothetical protein